ncbi:hypothetical protein ASG29_11380 [Sphingomonas sp. Leaf412]|uniref:DUF2855 family protein n=1 Tax=Sphingomonas sp. Leaf412 TaxID=1736370 RepID=UPI0006FF4FA2|nr:DUF2855 family protein [Sphingomonas sp. Leaf412]KQT32386.1 hypothetical protein ASG29_11380 [Sphingomonas sp. Leaf412]
MQRWDIQIDRGDIAQARVVDAPAADLAAGEIELAIDLIAITANNVTYAVFGEPAGILGPDAGYWDFFSRRDGPGRLPVWGFATVARSTVDGIAAGEQFYGYWPLASHVVMRPERIGRVGFTDGAGRRAGLPAFYNNYQRLAALDDHAAVDHDLWPVWRPLFVTGWLIADQLADEGDHGAAQVLVTAASSKTALGFAHAFRGRTPRPTLIGLTSARSADFVRGTGLYDDVVTYDALDTLPVAPVAIVDLAGDAAVNARLRDRLGDALRFDLVVGATHWDAARGEGDPAGVARSFFFAPARIEKRAGDWGGAVLRQRMGEAWGGFMPVARSLTALDTRDGAAAALAAYRDAVSGKADPAVAVLVRP